MNATADLTDLQVSIIHHLNYQKKIREGIYLRNTPHVNVIRETSMMYGGQGINEMNIMVGLTPGGAWFKAGSISVESDRIILSTANVYSVVYSTDRPYDRAIYPYAEPGFPDNLIEQLDQIAINYIRANSISRKRAWNQKRRKRWERLQQNPRAIADRST